MKTKVLTVILLLSASLFAWDKTQSQNQHQTVNSNNTVSNSHNNTATGGNATGGNASGQSTSYSSQEQHQTPFAYAPESIPTAPCRIGKSGGGSSPYFGLALGGSGDDKECEKRVAAAAFADIGNPVAAARILCTLKAARAADLTLDDCLAFAKPEPVPAPPAPEMPTIIVPAPAVTINPIIERGTTIQAEPLVIHPAVCQKPVHKHLTKPCPTLEK